METIFKNIEEAIQQVVGKGGGDLQVGQVILRALIMYLIALAVIRLGKKRLLGRNTAFDVVLGVIVGSMFSRTIHSDVPFLGSIVAVGVLIFLHAIFASLAFQVKGLDSLVKGHTSTLVKDGQVQWDAMRKHDVTMNDLTESMRLKLNSEDLSKVQIATLERNGNVSFVARPTEPKVVEVEVREGVQKIRIEIH